MIPMIAKIQMIIAHPPFDFADGDGVPEKRRHKRKTGESGPPDGLPLLGLLVELIWSRVEGWARGLVYGRFAVLVTVSHAVIPLALILTRRTGFLFCR
jgi:hypothetical protein